MDDNKPGRPLATCLLLAVSGVIASIAVFGSALAFDAFPQRTQLPEQPEFYAPKDKEINPDFNIVENVAFAQAVRRALLEWEARKGKPYTEHKILKEYVSGRDVKEKMWKEREPIGQQIQEYYDKGIYEDPALDVLRRQYADVEQRYIPEWSAATGGRYDVNAEHVAFYFNQTGGSQSLSSIDILKSIAGQPPRYGVCVGSEADVYDTVCPNYLLARYLKKIRNWETYSEAAHTDLTRQNWEELYAIEFYNVFIDIFPAIRAKCSEVFADEERRSWVAPGQDEPRRDKICRSFIKYRLSAYCEEVKKGFEDAGSANRGIELQIATWRKWRKSNPEFNREVTSDGEMFHALQQMPEWQTAVEKAEAVREKYRILYEHRYDF